jgi:uncharacterized damage-inducible protein DinB
MAARHRRLAVPDTYARALGGDDPVEAMAEAPDRLRRALRGLTEKQLATRPAPGKWTIKEILAHLADGEVILGSRYRFIAAHDRPPIQSYEQDLFAAKLGALNAKGADLVDDFAMVRAANLGLLERLPAGAWKRVGLHEERGEESIWKLVCLYAGHDRHHIAQVETIRTGLFPRAGRQRAKKRPRRPASGRR